MLRGQKAVPCQVVQADRARQAAAYAAVNGNITKTTAQQLYHARLAAKDPASLALAEVCAAAEVEIVRRIQSNLKRGQRLVRTFRLDRLVGRDPVEEKPDHIAIERAERLNR